MYNIEALLDIKDLFARSGFNLHEKQNIFAKTLVVHLQLEVNYRSNDKLAPAF
jgi:hypothetical protein